MAGVATAKVAAWAGVAVIVAHRRGVEGGDEVLATAGGGGGDHRGLWEEGKP